VTQEPSRTTRWAGLRRPLLALVAGLAALAVVAGVWTLIAGASQWSGLWTTRDHRIGRLTISIERTASGYLVVPYDGQKTPQPGRADRATLWRAGELKLVGSLFGRPARLVLTPDHVTLRLIVGTGRSRWTADFGWTTAPSGYHPSRLAIRAGHVLPLLVGAG
jgi:hypothetical protein